MPKNSAANCISSLFTKASAALAILFLFVNSVASARQPAYFMLGEEKFRGVQIYDVIQDKEQNYWFATNEGIYFFDYYNYTKIECNEAKNQSVFGFTMNKKGTIYCHNLNNQIFEIRKNKCSLFYELNKDESYADISLSIADDESLVIGAKKIIVLNENGSVKNKFPKPPHYLSQPFINSNGGIQFHISNTDSILIYSKGKLIMKELSYSSPEATTPFLLKFFRTGATVSAVDLTTKRLYRYDESRFHLSPLAPGNFMTRYAALRMYSTGNELWAAGTLPGISLALAEDAPVFFEDYFISDVFQDAEGNILFSTFDKGVLVVPDMQVQGVIDQFRNDPARSLYDEPESGLIIGTSKGSLLRYNGTHTDTLLYAGNRAIEGIYGFPGSDYVIYDNGSIHAYNKISGKIADISGLALKDAAFVSADHFFLGTNFGVMDVTRDSPDKFTTKAIKGISNRVYSMEYNPSNGSLYVSTSNGLLVLDSAGITGEVQYNQKGIYPNQLHFHDGAIYASTRTDGVLIIRDNQVQSRIIPTVNGKQEALYKIALYDGCLYGNSSNGFYCFDLTGKLLKSFHSAFGFSEHRILDFIVGKKHIWVCHSGGVQQISSDYPAFKMIVPALKFANLLVNDSIADLNGNEEFSSDQHKFVFTLSAPTIRNRGTTHYQYRLIGNETEWNISNYESNRITYNALAPGTYTLLARAENQGIFSPEIRYSFTIAYPFYQRWWFISSAILLFLSLVWIIYKRQLNIQQKKSKLLNELNASKLTAIQSQMNPHFIFNSLNSIQDLILKGDIENSYSYITTFSNLVRRTLNYSDKDFIDFEQEIKLLELYLSLEKLRFKKSLNYELNTGNISDILIPPLLIQPFIENALVHGLLHKEGEKKLSVSFELKDALICIIEDNGIGREKSKAIKQRQRSEHESFSGKAIRKRFEILSTALEGNFGYVYEDLYNGNEPAGTRVTLTIPVKRKY